MAICTWCKKEFIPSKNSHGKYCSNKCQGRHKSDIMRKEWLKTGIIKSNSKWLSAPSSLYVRGYLYDRQNGVCDICKLGVWNNLPIPLHLDHIDGDCENNHESNLRLICPNCDAQTPFHGGKNRGRGRKSKGYKY
jgi:hypothetical protein